MSATYETKIASWPESMGIMVAYLAEGEKGDNPFRKRVDYHGNLIHGHYEENNDHGGGLPVVGPDPTKLPDGVASEGNPFTISNFVYNGADFRLPGQIGRPPTVASAMLHAATWAISIVVGMGRRMDARPPMKSMAGWLNGVSIQPGHIALTRMFAGANSTASAFVNAMIAPLEAL